MVKRMTIKEWLLSIFPVISMPMGLDPREATIQLVSIGELAKNGLDQLILNTLPDATRSQKAMDDLRVMMVGASILDAYGEILMYRYDIKKSELLPPEKVVQLAKECVDGRYEVKRNLHTEV